ncbi:NADPH:quinone reductase [uncultured Roseobacter sp.]|uniref:NADPH:quinone reductase n=1 Tax=uncultured Roseobacter sp. TaxID=114847 RepID=UPI00261C9047|nr:NADPH:quinone reductase [uncultured Roseobacter sp.]
MKAVIYRKTGPASEVLETVDIDKPQPKPGEVLVRIRASGVNPTDTKTRAGIFPIQGEWSRILPHHDGAGVIEEVGEGVSQGRLGQRVWLYATHWGGADGTAAEYAVTAETQAVPLPDNVSFEEAATFGVPLLTAYHAVTMDGSVEGRTILVQGGAGAVGAYAIQIALAKGATVIATVSSDDKARAAAQNGAHHVINYKREDVVARVHEITDGTGVDHIIEVNLGANATSLPRLLRNGGFVAAYGSEAFTGDFPMVEAVVQQMRMAFFIVFMLRPDVLDRTIADVSGMLAARTIRARIHACYSPDQIAEAHDAVDTKSTIGNVVVRF